MENKMDQDQNQTDIEEEILQDTEEADTAEEPETAQACEDTEADAEENADTEENADAEEAEAEAAGAEEDTEGGEAADEASEAESGKSGGKKGFFKKNKKKDKKDEKIEELTDQVKRQMAEFDNFRKRTEKEKSQMYEIGAKSIIEKVLPVVDNFERGLAAVPEENQEDAFVDGMNKIYKQLMTMLEEADVKPIEAVGKEFDPNLHNAVMQTESDEYESGIVAQELQKGYTYRDSVVRHSMVAVVS